MKDFCKILFTSAAAIAGIGSAMALTAEEYCDPKINAPVGVKEMRPMKDGTSYTAVSADGKKIDVFSYRTGQKTSTLFDVETIKGEVRIDDFDGYSINSTEKKILLWNNVEKIYRNSFYADYYVYDILRGTLKKVREEGRIRGAVMSHDGRMVAYTKDNNIYIANLDYGTDNQITADGKINEVIYGIPDWSYEEEFGIDNTMRWSADDVILAFMRFDEKEVPTYSFDVYKSYCESNPLSDLYPEAYSYKYPLSGFPNSVVSVFSYNLDNRTTKKMDIPVGDGYIPSLEFDGNGKNLMTMVLNRDQNHLMLYSVNPGSTVAHLILTEESNAWLSPSAYQMVRYGKSSFVIGSERSGYCHLYEYNYSGSLLRQITSGEFNVTEYYGSNTAGIHYVQTTLLGAVNRNVCSVNGKGTVTPLNNQAGWETAYFSSNFEYYLRSWSDINTPNQYTLWKTGGKKIVDLEMNESYAAKYASAPRKELLKVRNDAGEEMDACMLRPTDFNPSKKYPLLMYQYNGPDSQLVQNRWRIEGISYLASEGYVVCIVDGRGTTARSRQWAHAVYKKLGQLETKDQIAGANYFASQPFIDRDRVACFGWSYGGYMTLMELSEKNNPFKAGIAMAPVTDWRFYDSIYTERYMLTPAQNESGYGAGSALGRTENMDRRLLIMSGTSDDNVHFYNTLKYTSKLNSEGKIFDMMAYTGFEHSLPMCNARTMLFKKILDFLNTNLN